MSLEWAVGQRMTAARLNRRGPITASKLANSPALTSDATVNADPDLVLSGLWPDTTYDVTGVLYVTSATNNVGDFRRGWAWTNSATVTMGGSGGVNTIASGSSGDGEWLGIGPDNTSPSGEITYVASTTVTAISVSDRITTDADEVDLTLTWAQATSNASGTTLLAGSRLTATPVDGD